MHKTEIDELYRRLTASLVFDSAEARGGTFGAASAPTPAQVVDHLTQVLGSTGFRLVPSFTLRERPRRDGDSLWEARCALLLQLGETRDGDFVAFAETSGAGGGAADSAHEAQDGALAAAIHQVMSIAGSSWKARCAPESDDVAGAADDTAVICRVSRSTGPSAELSHLSASDPSHRPVSRGTLKPRSPVELRITRAQARRLRELADADGIAWSVLEARATEDHGAEVERLTVKRVGEFIGLIQLEAMRDRGRCLPTRNGAGAEGRP